MYYEIKCQAVIRHLTILQRHNPDKYNPSVYQGILDWYNEHGEFTQRQESAIEHAIRGFKIRLV